MMKVNVDMANTVNWSSCEDGLPDEMKGDAADEENVTEPKTTNSTDHEVLSGDKSAVTKTNTTTMNGKIAEITINASMHRDTRKTQ